IPLFSKSRTVENDHVQRLVATAWGNALLDLVVTRVHKPPCFQPNHLVLGRLLLTRLGSVAIVLLLLVHSGHDMSARTRVMGRWLAVVVALGCGALGGCRSSEAERTTARLHGPPPAAVVGEDVVHLDVFVIERPLGDVFLNRELWSEADEQTVRADGEQSISLERKTALENNGFRVGQVGGALP